jgi:predicted DNA repair protein MutK
VVGKPLITQILVVSAIAVLATIGVYGIVALIVRMDDVGCRLINWQDGDDGLSDRIGRFLANALPRVIKALSVVGTLALLLVSGGIFNHNLEFMHHVLEDIPSLLKDFRVGLVVGSLAVLLLGLVKKLFKMEGHSA